MIKTTNTWNAFHSQRHPITRVSVNLRRIRLKSEAEARRVEKDLVIRVNQKVTLQTDPAWPLFLNEYFLFKRDNGWAAKTLADARIMLSAHTGDRWRTTKLSTINRKMVLSLVHESVGNKSAATQQTLVKYLRGVFQYAVESSYLTSNPAASIKVKVGEKIKGVLTGEQVKYLLDKAKACNHPWYFHWVLALYTGMRNGELFALTWDKVNLDSKQIKVDSSWNKVAGFKDTKSGHDRIVAIAPNLVHVLKELKLQSGDQHFVLPRSRDWDKGEQARTLRLFLLGLGLPPMRFHDLRATWATMMLSNGVEPIKVMLMGGWRTLKDNADLCAKSRG